MINACTATINLHSTMYLLNHNSRVKKDRIYFNLHSTMYLLNLVKPVNSLTHCVRFTFHYVSIKSIIAKKERRIDKNLHSTMYLLNLRYVHTVFKINKIYIPLCIY